MDVYQQLQKVYFLLKLLCPCKQERKLYNKPRRNNVYHNMTIDIATVPVSDSGRNLFYEGLNESIAETVQAQKQFRYAQERKQQRKYCCDKLKQAVDGGFVVQDSIPFGKWLMRDLRTADIVFDH